MTQTEQFLNTNIHQNSLKAWLRALDAVKMIDVEPGKTLPCIIDNLASIYGTKYALIGENERLSYGELAVKTNNYAQWVLKQNLPPGSVICLMMPNCAEFVAIWLGITQTGCIAALINTTLVGEMLAHSIRTAQSTCIVVAQPLLQSVSAIAILLPETMQYWVHGGLGPFADPHYLSVEYETKKNTPVIDIPEERRPAMQQTALLIYTSGTTGMPKAANVTHRQLLEWSYWFAGMMDVKPEDRLYNCLPMYHSIGGVVAVGSMLVKGASVVIRPRFSISRFWDDIIDNECTIFQYIGELCSYLTRSKPHQRETAHRLRLCCGNGLRQDVWINFKARFQIPQILEYYAATEGAVSLYNCEEKPGAIGRVPGFLAHRFPVMLIKCDAETGNVLRDETGLCIRCESGEAGEAIGKMPYPLQSSSRQASFYTDPAASARKILRNVLVPGDYWFRTGDFMRKDSAGYYYFVDRIGDTFRWKGENVSTAQVASVINACAGVMEVVVFGVKIPGYEGRAGMAAITIDDTFSLAYLQTYIAENLPEYARPIFVRVCTSLETTCTFKLKKETLLREGFASPSARGAIWFYDRMREAFVPCDQQCVTAILNGQMSRL